MNSFSGAGSTLVTAAVLTAAGMALAAGDHDGHDMSGMTTQEAHEGDGHGAMKTVTGEVVDITCYVRMVAKGPDHTKCAVYCAGLGMPIGILEDGTETIYLILPEGHAAPQEAVPGFVGKRVTAKLKLHEKGGLKSAEVMEIGAAEG